MVFYSCENHCVAFSKMLISKLASRLKSQVYGYFIGMSRLLTGLWWWTWSGSWLIRVYLCYVFVLPSIVLGSHVNAEGFANM